MKAALSSAVPYSSPLYDLIFGNKYVAAGAYYGENTSFEAEFPVGAWIRGEYPLEFGPIADATISYSSLLSALELGGSNPHLSAQDLFASGGLYTDSLYDLSVSALAADIFNRQLLASNGSDVTLDWQSMQLWANGGSMVSLDWGTRKLKDTGGNEVACWDGTSNVSLTAFQIIPSGSLGVDFIVAAQNPLSYPHYIDVQSAGLSDGAILSVKWVDQILQMHDGSYLTTSLDWNQRQLMTNIFDGTWQPSVDWQNYKLQWWDGAYLVPVVDWSTQELLQPLVGGAYQTALSWASGLQAPSGLEVGLNYGMHGIGGTYSGTGFTIYDGSISIDNAGGGGLSLNGYNIDYGGTIYASGFGGGNAGSAVAAVFPWGINAYDQPIYLDSSSNVSLQWNSGNSSIDLFGSSILQLGGDVYFPDGYGSYWPGVGSSAYVKAYHNGGYPNDTIEIGNVTRIVLQTTTEMTGDAYVQTGLYGGSVSSPTSIGCPSGVSTDYVYSINSTGGYADFYNGQLAETANSHISVDWVNRILYAWDGAADVAMLNWSNYSTLSAGAPLDMNSHDINGVDVLSCVLIRDSGFADVFDLTNRLIYEATGTNPTADFDTCKLYDATYGYDSIYWEARQLVSSDGSTIVFDWDVLVNGFIEAKAAFKMSDDVLADKTNAGSTGAQTINKNAGSVEFAAAATSLVVTNSRVTANSIILATVATNDSTMLSVQAVPASGSFTLYANAAATAQTRVNWWVVN